MSDVSDILRKAADLIEPEGCWTQGAYAKTARGRGIGPCEPAAVCWCAEGAITASGGNLHSRSAVTRYLNIDDLSVWNDRSGRTQTEVVQALRFAANLAEGKL